jgi:hypothetical protein
MQIVECPLCREKAIKIYTIGKDNVIDFALENATQTAICWNCKKEVRYSVRKNKGDDK